ncbi:hypothetical protein ACET3Z_031410 [Daucus carota]
MSALCLHEMPPIFYDSILPTFVRGYNELMLETFGPTYERPDFKNVPPKRKARRTTKSTSQPFESEYFREYEAYEQTTSALFESTQYDVGPCTPQYEVGQSQIRDQFCYRPIIDFGEDHNVPIAHEDPIVPIKDFGMEDLTRCRYLNMKRDIFSNPSTKARWTG